MIQKVLAGCTGLVVLMAIAGCAHSDADTDAFNPYPQVSVSTRDITVQTPVIGRMGADQLLVHIPVYNRTNSDIDLAYKFHFVDANGIQVEGDNAWLSRRISGKGVETIAFNSQTSSAADFRVQMRRKRFE